jgi:hypothetical protein
MRLILSQSHFTFQNKTYQPEKDVSMGSPIPSTTAEIFLQYFEDRRIKQLMDIKNLILHKHNISPMQFNSSITVQVLFQYPNHLARNVTFTQHICIKFKPSH